MPWQPCNFTQAASLNTLVDPVINAINRIENELISTENRLNDVPEKPFTTSPTQAQCVGALNISDDISNLFIGDCNFLVCHPWQHGIGQQTPQGHQGARDFMRYLSAANAVQAVVEKLNDTNDTSDTNDVFAPQNTKDAALMVISAVSLSRLASAIETFTQVLPLPELTALAQRCLQLDELERTKLNRPQPPLNSLWSTRSLQQLEISQKSISALTPLISQAVSCESETNPINELQALAEKKRMRIQEQKNTVTRFKNQFINGEGRVCFFTATNAPSLANKILNSLQEDDAPQHSHSLSVAVLITASSGKLQFLQQTLGL